MLFARRSDERSHHQSLVTLTPWTCVAAHSMRGTNQGYVLRPWPYFLLAISRVSSYLVPV